ncbi:MAG TPA: TonB-dependent receptor [Ferruginibacter sp.]|nr:TonB-dependent receptor [Ferruginibacter sp.]HNK29057.1 TonB-dependent receptor [Ferruginibacter sp.]
MIRTGKVLAITLLVLCFSVTYAQMPGMGGGRGQMGGQNMNMGHFYGKVLDSVSNKPLEAASVQLIQNKFDSATKKRKDVVVGGMLTTKKGEFSIENLPIMATYKLKITAIGYKTIEKRVNFEMNMSAARSGDFSSMLSAVDKDLGNIKLEADAKQLENVTVSASKATLEMKIDRKVFNVEKNLNSVGGTAVDVMKNVPSVNVDIDGNVSLRNASPQIFVDGRPTTMTLDQIPADAIASVEIITNPSAKYDASGGGAGILNIILKKNRKAGYNGNLRAGIDMRGRPNLGGDVNMKQGKVNFFAAGQFGMRKSISNVKTDRVDYNADTTSYLKQRNKPINSGFFAFGRAGMDYFIDNRNTLSIGGNLVRGQFKTTDLINTYRDTVRPSGTISDRGERGSKSTGNFRNYGATLSFKHNFAKANKELTADFNYNYSKNDNVGDYTTQYFFSNNSPKTPQFIEQSKGGGTNRFITIQTDYADPITSSMKIEAGLRAAFRNFTSFNNNFVQTTPGQYLLIPGLSNDYKFNDELYAGYLTFSHQRKKLSYQLGLRAESSSYTGNLVSKNQKFKTEYPLSLFPSAFATYKLNDKEDMQLNYSRKINRPNFFQLIPFIDYSDSLNLSVGNPGLIPEFTNLLELSYSNQYKAGNSLLATVYFRNTNDLITRYQYKDANPNPARADSVIITTYANANRSYTVGLELTGKNKPAKWWDLTTNLNLFNSTIKAGNIPGTVSSSLFSWFAKINNNFKLPKNFSIQLSADYTAKTLVAPGGGGNRGMGMMFGGGSQPSAQGYIKPIFGADFSIRKEFLKNNAASITLQFSDIFRTRLYATHNESAFFVQDNERRRDPQFVRLNFNWRFGKIDVSLFKRKNLKGEMENMQNAQQGMGGN